MPDEMDTLLATQRARIDANGREVLIKRARGTPSFTVMLHLVSGYLLLLFATWLTLSGKVVPGAGHLLLGTCNLFIGYHRMTNERIAAILALLDEEKHGPKEAWIRRLQQPAPRP